MRRGTHVRALCASDSLPTFEFPGGPPIFHSPHFSNGFHPSQPCFVLSCARSIPAACLARHTRTPTTRPIHVHTLPFCLALFLDTYHKHETGPGGRACRTSSRGSGVCKLQWPSRTRRRFVRAGFSSPANLNRIARSRSSTFYSDSVQHLITPPFFSIPALSLLSLFFVSHH